MGMELVKGDLVMNQAKNMPEPPLKEWIGRSQNGDLDAFSLLMEKTQGYAFALAGRFSLSREDAEDVVQEAFVRIWKNLGLYDYRCQFTTWMYRIVVNLCLDFLRKENRSQSRKRELVDEGIAAVDADAEAEYVKAQLAKRVRQLARKLPERQRAVFVLRDLQDLEMDEVASVLKISMGAVKASLCHARRFIRERMHAFEER